MRWDYGSVYKEIRRAKKLSQEQVCGGNLNRSTLVRFEKNETVPSYEHMRFLLQQVDMSFEEFEYICYYYHPSPSQKLLYEIDNLKFPSNSQMEDLVKRCQKELHKNPDSIPIKRRMLALQAVLELRSNLKGSKEKIKELLWQEISNYDIWYHNDIRIIGSIIAIFPIEAIEEVTNLLLKHLEKYQEYKNIQVTILSIYHQLTDLFLHYQRLEKSALFAQKTIQLAKTLKRYDCLALGRIYLGLAQEQEGLIQSGLALLENTEEVELLEHMKNLIKQRKMPDEG